jgi:hypothetical protein
MKKVLFIAALVAASFAGQAQTSKGTYLLGGGAGFNSTTGATTWNISPNAGYFVIDNLAAGASVSIAGAGGGTSFGVGPFVRYYFVSLGKAKVFGNAGFNYNKPSVGGSTTSVGAAAGLAYFLNQSIALETALGYTNNTTAKTSNIGLNVGFQIHFKK